MESHAANSYHFRSFPFVLIQLIGDSDQSTCGLFPFLILPVLISKFTTKFPRTRLCALLPLPVVATVQLGRWPYLCWTRCQDNWPCLMCPVARHQLGLQESRLSELNLTGTPWETLKNGYSPKQYAKQIQKLIFLPQTWRFVSE